MKRLASILFLLTASAAWAGNFGEAELRDLLTAKLQADVVKDKGELELRLLRAWSPVTLPDGEVSVKLLDLPATGVNPNFILRFELHVAGQARGPFQMPVEAKVWREVLVARAALRAGQPLAEAEVAPERRDMLAIREACWAGDADAAYELSAYVPAGAPVTARAVRLRPVVRRGQNVEALLRQGALSLSMKVEVLEDGAPGQLVRLRNGRSKKEFTGKVQDERTILVDL